MRKKFIEGMRLPLSVMLSLSVALSAVPVQAFADPAPAIEQDVQADEVAAASVEANDETVSIADIKVALGLDVADGDESTQASISDALDLIIGSVNLAEDLPNYTAENNRGLAISMGLVDYNTDLGAAATGNFVIKAKDYVGQFKTAAHATVKKPLFLDGKAQPIFPFTPGDVDEDKYSNADSQTIRYSVWIETNYDTDGDGNKDMIKAVVQLPLAAARGDYQAATIYEARPYISGCTDMNKAGDLERTDEFDMSKLHAAGKAHEATNRTTTMEHAANAKSSEWWYVSPYESSPGYDFMDYESLNWYNYYLSRGYAVVTAAGLGTRGSDGFETCGSDVEIDAFKCVI